MARKSGKPRKIRVDFRPNRNAPGRSGDVTRQYRESADDLIDGQSSESVRAKGELSRKRTVIVDEHGAPLVDPSQLQPGVVTRVLGQVCQVDDARGDTWECTVRRVLRTMQIDKRSGVTVGDRVWFAPVADSSGQRGGVIERVEERRTHLSRRDRRQRAHTIVANADQLLIVASVAEPRIKPHLIDRYIVAGVKGGLRPAICLNKFDLHDSAGDRADCEDRTDAVTVDDMVAEFGALGYPVVCASARSGQGLDALCAVLKDRVSVLSGQSGVGKTSLINAIQPGLELATAEVSDANEKGRHTTTNARLLRLSFGGYVVDTPGIRQFDLWDLDAFEFEACFVEFLPHLPQCRFKDCLHEDGAEGCAVIAAVEDGRISPRRYFSYLKMIDDARAGRR
ncbi:MAG: Small ribosomal subunit biogenesis GTPase RsgA [Phycisphaerae bacterium]|nr:Small ribosomal subunit biogenesis GTPase RsgA [Phycisphaerae bacterium]